MSETEELILRKQAKLTPSEDFEALRKAGVGYIEALAKEVWTDYNVHDPGITLLEALCYGITDLGYRTAHQMRDLLTRDIMGVPTLAGTFHPAHRVLPGGPVTFLDLRKLLVDIPGVRHAWIEKHTSVTYALDEARHRLVEVGTVMGEKPLGPLHGLYDVFVELEETIDDLRVGVPDWKGSAGHYRSPEVGGLHFTVDRELILREVSVYADCPGDVVITVRDAGGAAITPPIRHHVDRAGQKTALPLDLFITPPLDPKAGPYVLSAAGSGVRLYASTDAEFPFEEEGLLTLHRGRDGLYDYFYDWVVDYARPGDAGVPTTYPSRTHTGLPDLTRSLGDYQKPERQAILFDVESDLVLHGVYVYGDKRGEVEVVILNDAGEEVARCTVRIREAGARTWVSFETPLPMGQQYRMVARSREVMLHTSRSAAFPYLVPHALTLIGGEREGRLGQLYSFFYDWEFTYQKPVGLDAPATPSSRSAVLAAVRHRIQAHRNLCQDIVSIKELRPEDVGICADIDVDPATDINAVLAEVYYALEAHVKPPVRFYTLDQLRAEPHALPIEQIFEGPLLNHGFIRSEELAGIVRSRELRASDIIQMIADIAGVRAVRNLVIVSFIDGELESEARWVWCPTELPCRVANFTPARSNITFFKNGLPHLAQSQEVEDLLLERQLHDLPLRGRPGANHLPMPVGEDMDLETYYPVQGELPLNYMVGPYRVPASATTLREAQSSQLKAYLLFFEQLMANYLAQLAHLPGLFSWEEGAEVATYHTQPIDPASIAELEALYVDYPGLEGRLVDLVEDEPTALARRQRLLAHLAARFGETLSTYAETLYRVLGHTPDTARRLIADTRSFLTNYPAASGLRARAHDYGFPGEPGNLSGYQERVYRLLGIRPVTRRTFAGSYLRIVPRDDGRWCFVILGERERRLFESICCESRAAVETMLEFVMSHFPSYAGFRYEVRTCDGVDQLVRICEKNGEARVVGDFVSDCAIDDVWDALTACAHVEGFHVVEHLLLRKRQPDDPFLPVQLPADSVSDGAGPCLRVEDPYSFRVSIVLPAWSRRFYDPRFRAHVERVLREEAPAHIYLRICWVGHESMRTFEERFCAWEEALACLEPGLNGSLPYSDRAPSTYPTAYREPLEELIDILFRLESRHPAARLHDCAGGDTDMPPVILGSTNLTSI